MSEIFKYYGTKVGNTPLHDAATADDPVKIDNILTAKNITTARQQLDLLYARNRYMQTPMHMACMLGQVNAYSLLAHFLNDQALKIISKVSSPFSQHIENNNSLTDCFGNTPADYLKMYIEEKREKNLARERKEATELQKELVTELKELKTLIKEKSIDLGKDKPRRLMPSNLDNIAKKQQNTPALFGGLG